MQSLSRRLYTASQSEEGEYSPLSLQMFEDMGYWQGRLSEEEKPLGKHLACSLSIGLFACLS